MVKDNTTGSKILDIIIHIILIFVVVITLYPVLNIAATSLSSSVAVEKNLVTFYPKELTFKAYELIFKNDIIPNSFRNSIFYTVVGTIISLVMTILLAYPLSKKDLPLRRFYTVFLVITMYFSGGLIPSFLLIKRLGLYDSVWALLLPGAISTYNTMIMISFFKSLPRELEESAYLDGANDLIILIKIIIPLSTASIATIGLFYAVGKWNDWFTGMIYLKSSRKYPLPLILRELIIENKLEDMMDVGGVASNLNAGKSMNVMKDDAQKMVNADTLKYATLFVSMIPMLIIYPFVQKYFVKGVMIGSLKG
ncbi:MAG TPA: carbohydrate ABC transporter permease [Clostridiales bacterium]|nr:carbohydrate ABC transporter permease [Clostridiales bacterium]